MNKQVDQNDAKQGRRGSPVLLVLIGGLILAGLVWWGVEAFVADIGDEVPPTVEPADDLPTD